MSWRGPGVSAFCAEKAQQSLGKGRDIITCWLNLRRWYCSPFVVWFFSFFGLRTQLSSYSLHFIPSTESPDPRGYIVAPNSQYYTSIAVAQPITQSHGKFSKEERSGAGF